MHIKSHLLRLLAFIALGVFSASVQAHEKITAGPNGGRVLKTDPRAEFFVTPDRKVQITFVDQNNKAVAPGSQVVTVTAGERASPTVMKFTRAGNSLVSDVPLPMGNDIPTVIQVRANATAKSTTDKFNVDLNKCPDCKRGEYACICAEDPKKK